GACAGRRRVIIAQFVDGFQVAVCLIVLEDHHPYRVLNGSERRPGDRLLPCDSSFHSRNIREQRLLLFEQMRRKLIAQLEEECLKAFQLRMSILVLLDHLHEKKTKPSNLPPAKDVMRLNDVVHEICEGLATPGL